MLSPFKGLARDKGRNGSIHIDRCFFLGNSNKFFNQ